MNRIDQTFSRLKRSGQKALIGYVTAGFPTKSRFAHSVRRLEKAGLNLLEIGIPFSDPVADGTTVQNASQKALNNGVTLDWIFKNVARLRRDVRIPIIFMTYSNSILALGMDRFFARAKSAGADGVIIPDVTPDEGRPFEQAARTHGLHVIYLVTPNTSRDRLKRIASATKGFLYAVSLTGVTGARSSIAATVPGFLKTLKRATSKPVAMGFGISTPQQVQSIRRYVDGVIVGSALINHLERSLPHAEKFVRALQRALNPHAKGVNHAS